MENFFKIASKNHPTIHYQSVLKTARVEIKTQITDIGGLVTPRIKKHQTIVIRKITTFTHLQAGELETFNTSLMGPHVPAGQAIRNILYAQLGPEFLIPTVFNRPTSNNPKSEKENLWKVQRAIYDPTARGLARQGYVTTLPSRIMSLL